MMKEILRERAILYLNRAKMLMTKKVYTLKKEIELWDRIEEYFEEAEFLYRATL
mgnify:CR=1 FL=1